MPTIGHIVIDIPFLIKYGDYIKMVNGQLTLQLPREMAAEFFARYPTPQSQNKK